MTPVVFVVTRPLTSHIPSVRETLVMLAAVLLVRATPVALAVKSSPIKPAGGDVLVLLPFV